MRTILLLIMCLNAILAYSQDNYEIQVYGSETVEKGKTMFELHSNYTFQGNKEIKDGMLPTNHIIHETIEITHGFTPWFEVGFYLFNAIGDQKRTSYVGSHIRPRISIPKSWGLPVGLSLSAEFGLQKSIYSANTSTLELRPILDKKWHSVYFAFNPVFGKSFHGPDSNRGLIFSPNLKISEDLTKSIAIGIEYYGSTGPILKFDNLSDQQHQIFLATDLNIGPLWELNAGIGFGLTKNTDHSIFKLIVGRKI